MVGTCLKQQLLHASKRRAGRLNEDAKLQPVGNADVKGRFILFQTIPSLLLWVAVNWTREWESILRCR